MNIEILVHPRSDVFSMDVNLFENDVMESKNQILQVSGQSSETKRVMVIKYKSYFASWILRSKS